MGDVILRYLALPVAAINAAAAILAGLAGIPLVVATGLVGMAVSIYGWHLYQQEDK